MFNTKNLSDLDKVAGWLLVFAGTSAVAMVGLFIFLIVKIILLLP